MFVSAVDQWIEYPWFSTFTEHKHIFKAGVVSLCVWIGDGVLFVYHGVMNIEANLLKMKGLSETCATFTIFGCLITNNPDNNTTRNQHTFDLFCDGLKVKNIAIVLS